MNIGFVFSCLATGFLAYFSRRFYRTGDQQGDIVLVHLGIAFGLLAFLMAIASAKVWGS